MNVTGIKLTRQGRDTVVLIEVGSRWVEVIREPFEGCFDHIINESGMQTRNKQDATDRIHKHRADVWKHAEPLLCANCQEVSNNRGQFLRDHRWVCCEKCRLELPSAFDIDEQGETVRENIARKR